MYLTVKGTSTSHKKHCCLLTATIVMRMRHNVTLHLHFPPCIFSGATAQIGPGPLTVIPVLAHNESRTLYYRESKCFFRGPEILIGPNNYTRSW